MKWNRTAVSAFFFVNGFSYASWAARIPELQELFKMNHQILGVVLLCASIGALIAMPFTGWFITRYSSKQITKVSGVLFLLAIPTFPLSPNVFTLMATFFFMGITTGMMDVAMNAQAVEVERNATKPIMSFFHAMFSAGMMLGAGVGVIFVSMNIGLFTHFASISVLGLLVLGSMFKFLVAENINRSVQEEHFFRLPDPALIGIGVIAFCCMLGEGAMADWSSNYMLRIVGVDKVLGPFALFAFSLAMMTGRFIGDRGRIYFGDNYLLIIGSMFAIAGMAITVIFPIALLVIIGHFLIGLGLATIVPIAYSQAGNVPGLAPGVGIGMVTTIGYAGFLFGPPIIGFIADLSNLRMAFVFILALFAVMLFLSFRISNSKSSHKVVT